MLEALFSGFVAVFTWPAIGFLLLGVLIGVWLGAVPGLGGILGLVILLPFTYGMDSVSAFALLLGLYAVTSTSDTIASVMLGIPGTAASQATILDGHPLAQQGQAARAFGAAFTVSAFGGVFGALVMAVSLPIILPVILAFGSPEFFALGLLGLSMVGALSGGSILKGLTVALLGLLLATVGYAETSPVPRYWFGMTYLLDGIPLIPVVLGLFAIPELLDLATRDTSISRVPAKQSEGGGLLEGIRDAIRNWWLVLRCSVIGTYIGMLPGLGGAIVDWFAYGHAVQSARDKSRFGQGDIRGVIAPEAANNASRGGSLVPTVAFGIPGSLGAAILMGALLIQGLRPGPDMLTTHLDLTFSMVWTLVVANLVAAAALMVWSQQVAKVAFIRGHLIVPAVILFVFMGAWLGGGTIGDWITCFTMGVVGYVMKRGGWPRPPLVLALILGPLLENAFVISMRIHDGPSWLGRPIVVVVLFLVAVTILSSVRGTIRMNRTADEPATGEGRERNAIISWPFTLLIAVAFVWAGTEALDWSRQVRQFPLAIAVPGAVLAIAAFVQETGAVRTLVHQSGGLSAAALATSDSTLLLSSATFLTYLLCVVLLAFVIGQQLALCIFIATYLWRWGGYNWKIALGYAACGWIVLYGFYDKVMHVPWHQSWLLG